MTLRADRTASLPTSATAVVPIPLPCPWCGAGCTGEIRAEHLRLDRQSETTTRRRWAA